MLFLRILNRPSIVVGKRRDKSHQWARGRRLHSAKGRQGDWIGERYVFPELPPRKKALASSRKKK